MIQPFSKGTRLGIAAMFFVAGFVFPLFFVVAGTILLSIVADRRRPKDPDADKWLVRRWNVTPADDDWVSCFLPFCESPAETAFLEAMISAFDLKPELGVLKSATLKLDLQVKIPPYRVDFLANDWLVIEIDGAAYHSSPEAVAKDSARDKDLENGPYKVLRIPAKEVFTDPGAAVRQVRATIASGQMPRKTVGSVPRVSPIPTAKGILSGLARLSEQFSSHMATTLAVQEAMKSVELAFAREKSVFDAAINLARHKIEIEELRNQHCLDQEFLDQAKRDLDEAIQRRGGGVQKLRPVAEVPVIVRPNIHRDASIDGAIQRHFDGLMTARSLYYAEISEQIRLDDRLSNFIRPSLREIGCDHFWDLFVSQTGRAKFRAFLKSESNRR